MRGILILLLLAFAVNTKAQQCRLYGKITDKYTGDELINANVFISETKATSADLSGNYSIELPYGSTQVEFSFVGYVAQKITVNLNSAESELNVKLTSIELDEAEVFADIAIGRETPVAFTNIDSKKVEEELASQDIPMLLNSAPGVYATQQGGGDGDARITIRGFSQRNIAVMLDGVPVNDMENGWVYWSNWFGLDAIMQTTQVQRGLGVSKLAIPSVGGTINILTKGIEQNKSTKIKQEVASNGFLRSTIGHTSGRLPGDWGFTVAASYKQGNGWVDGNWTQGFFYYGKVQKSIGNHILTLSGFGAPQSHGQRSFTQGIRLYDHEYAEGLGLDTAGYLNLGLNYNIHNGNLTRYELDESGNQINQRTEELNERKNYYHKPQFSLRHSWRLSDKFSVNNVAYLSIGNGGGTRLDGSASLVDLNDQGVLDFQRIYDAQTGYSYDPEQDIFGIGDPSINSIYSDTERISFDNYLKSSVNNHFWYGLLSTFNYKPNEKFKYSGGIDARSYRGEHYREIYDLLGGDYILDLSDRNSPEKMKREGDKIDFYNDSFVEWGGLFGQVEYKNPLWSVFFSASSAITRYKRIDYFQEKSVEIDGQEISPAYLWEDNATEPVVQEVVYDGVTYTPDSPELEYQTVDWIYKPGFTLKTGANYKFNDFSNVYINVGYLDRAPRFSNVIDFTNEVVVGAENEQIQAFEFGYGYKANKLSVNLNGYITDWKNKPVSRSIIIVDAVTEKEIRANINGMDARHVGVELEAAYAVNSKLTLEGILSFGNWIWNSEETVFLFDDNNNPVIEDAETGEQATVYFDARGVHVGDAAQSQIGALARYQFKKGAYVKLRYTYFDRYYADFNPFGLSGDNAGRDSWQIPEYSLLELHAGYEIKATEKSRLNIRASILNLSNAVYVSDANNNSTFGVYVDQDQGFDAGSAAVFFGQGRRFNLSATLSF